jgi:hypothetical protein
VLYLVNVSGGPVTLTSPALSSASNTIFGTKITTGPVTSTNKLTVTAAAGTTIEESLEQSAPLSGVQGATAVYALTGDLGIPQAWFYDGTSKWWEYL